MILVVQHLVTAWTKRSRGAEGRELRARLPTSYPLPEALLASTQSCLRHVVRRSEQDGYTPTALAQRSSVLAATGALTVSSPSQADEALTVTFRGDSGECGQPRRDNGRLSLSAGQHLLVRFNGRHLSFDEPWYEDHLIHLAFGTHSSTGMFGHPPDLVLDRRVDLW